jgi:hypothetical protein
MKKFLCIITFITSCIFSLSARETKQQTLYRLRHTTHEYISVGTRHTGGIKQFKYRYIYHDNGQIVNGYIVDLYGNIRDDLTWEIVPPYSLPKYIQDLAMKSLE